MLESDNGRLKNIPDNTDVFELNGPMFFASSDKFAAIPVRDGVEVIILRMRSVPSLDVSALRSLTAVHKVCQEKNIRLILSHVNEQPLSVMKKAGFVDSLGEENFAANIDDAIAMAGQVKISAGK